MTRPEPPPYQLWVREDMTAMQERFWSKVGSPTPSGCREWNAQRTAGGYGKFSIGGRKFRAHRIAYELVVGRIPAGMQLDHLCRNPRCVNPSHLEPVSSRENTLRGISPSAKRARQTHCIHGHPFNDRNTHLSAKNQRVCRACHALHEAARRARKAAAA